MIMPEKNAVCVVAITLMYIEYHLCKSNYVLCFFAIFFILSQLKCGSHYWSLILFLYFYVVEYVKVQLSANQELNWLHACRFLSISRNAFFGFSFILYFQRASKTLQM